MARFPQIGNSSLIPKNIYKNKMQTNKEKKYTHKKKPINKNKKTQTPQKSTRIEFTTVIKSVLVTDISCRFYDRTND